MTSVVVARLNSKIAAFKEVASGGPTRVTSASSLPADGVDIICTLAADNYLTIRVQLTPLIADHSLAVSSERMGNIHVGLYKSFDILNGTRPRLLGCRFLPAGQGSGMVYTTGHGLSIHIVRLEGAGTVRVFARGGGPEFSCFQREVLYHASPLRVEVRDGFYVTMDRVMVA